MNIIDLATKTMQTAIKAVVDAIKTVVDGIKIKVDTVDTRTSTMNTNINTVNTNVSKLLNERVVKSIQRGSAAIGSSKSAVDVTINAIDKEKSFLVFSQTTNTGSEHITTRGNFKTTDNKTVTFTRSSFGNETTTIEWQVIEFY